MAIAVVTLSGFARSPLASNEALRVPLRSVAAGGDDQSHDARRGNSTAAIAPRAEKEYGSRSAIVPSIVAFTSGTERSSASEGPFSVRFRVASPSVRPFTSKAGATSRPRPVSASTGPSSVLSNAPPVTAIGVAPATTAPRLRPATATSIVGFASGPSQTPVAVAEPERASAGSATGCHGARSAVTT